MTIACREPVVKELANLFERLALLAYQYAQVEGARGWACLDRRRTVSSQGNAGRLRMDSTGQERF